MSRNGTKRAKITDEPDLDLDTTDDEMEEERKSLENKTVEEMCMLYFPKLTRMEKKVSKCVKALHHHNEEISELKKEVVTLKQEVTDLKAELQQQHRRSNENYLIVSGIKEEKNETETTLINTILNTFNSKMGLQVQLDIAFRIGKPTENKPRMVKVHFPILGHRNEVWKKRKALGHPIYVNEDLHPATRLIRSKLSKAFKEATAKGQTAKLNFKRNEITIDDTVHGFVNDILIPKPSQ